MKECIHLRCVNGLMYKLKFENNKRRHKYKVADLIENYMNFKDSNAKNMIFTLVTVFQFKNLLGKNLGYLSKTGFILMILTWLIHEGYLPNV